MGYHTILEDGFWPDTNLDIRFNPGDRFDTFMMNTEPVNQSDGFSLNKWHFIVVQRINGVMNMYVNNSLLSSVNINVNC